MNPEDIKVLIGCEESGTVRNAFSALGFDAWSCDLMGLADEPCAVSTSVGKFHGTNRSD